MHHRIPSEHLYSSGLRVFIVLVPKSGRGSLVRLRELCSLILSNMLEQADKTANAAKPLDIGKDKAITVMIFKNIAFPYRYVSFLL